MLVEILEEMSDNVNVCAKKGTLSLIRRRVAAIKDSIWHSTALESLNSIEDSCKKQRAGRK